MPEQTFYISVVTSGGLTTRRQSMTVGSTSRRVNFLAAAFLVPVLVYALLTSTGHPANAATEKKGPTTLTVTPTENLSAGGASVRVVGKRFNPRVGIYVALCVTPAKRSPIAPGPCGGGVNLAGRDPASVWVSSNPPAYGRSLAVPFAKGGRFRVTLTVSPMIGDIDCRISSCSVVTRADHTRSFDRNSDLSVPVTFD